MDKRLWLVAVFLVLFLVSPVLAANPTAAFSGTPLTGGNPLNTAFTDASTGSPTAWAWFFGDETYSGTWVQQNSTAAWAARSDACVVTLHDGSVVIAAGYTGGSPYLNDVWRSTDKGVNWVRQTAAGEFPVNENPACVVLDDDSILLIGGYTTANGYDNRTWRSTNQGVNWALQNATTPGWAGRYGQAVAHMADDSLLLYGGGIGASPYYANDTWRSTDKGVTWTLQNVSSGWSRRYYTINGLALSDGSAILLGGAGTNVPTDVWRTTDNGVTWVQQSATGTTARINGGAGVVMPDDTIVVMGGYNSSIGELNDVWVSHDKGVTWTKEKAAAEWSARSRIFNMATVLTDGSILIMGGGDGTRKRDVWRLNPTGSTSQNPSHSFTSIASYTVGLIASHSTGYDWETKTDYVEVLDVTAPVAAFSANATSGVSPLDVGFTDASTNTPTDWDWYWGADETKSSDLQNPTHQFTTGSYNIRLYASNSAGGDWENKTGYIVVGVVPESLWGSSYGYLGIPAEVAFTDTSTNSPTSWLWQWGDGTANSTFQNGNHTFTTVGTFEVNLTACNAFGCGAPTSGYYTTGTAADASFTADTNTGAAPLTVHFTDTSTGTAPLTYLWKFGDGTTNATANPEHTYAGVGTYYANLTASNSFGVANTTSDFEISVGVVPVASFTKDKTYVDYLSSIQFTDTSTGVPTSWLWQFRNVSTGVEFTRNTQNPNVVFTPHGEFVVNLTVDNAYGSDLSADVSIWCGVAPVIMWDYAPLPPQITGTPVTFTDLNWASPPYTNKWHIRAPNGTTYYNYSTGSPSVISFDSQGVWTVSETVSNLYGSVTSAFYAYEILNPVVANFTATPLSGYEYLPVQFTDTSSGTPTGWSWTFTNNIGTTFYNTTQNPLRYFVPGLWDITLVVSKAGTPDDTEVKVGYLNVSAVAANFTASNVTPIEEQTITFTDSSVGNPTGWNWSFGDGQYSSLQNPTHAYSGYSITYFKLFNVTLNITKAGVPDRTLTRTNYINVSQTKPTALAYVPNVTSGTGYLPPDLVVAFTGNYNPGYPDSVDWYFDGTHSTSWNPVATFDYHVQDPAIPVYVNYSYVNEMGRSNWYNSTYTFLGRVPKATVPIQFAPLSGTTIPPAHVHMQTLGYAAYDNGTWYGVPTSWYWTFGDGATDTTTTSLTNHTYAAGGTYPVTVRPSNVWGNGATETTNYTVLTLAPFGAPLKWVNNAGSTITTARKGDSLTFVFDTNVTGIGGLYNYDRFYINVFRMDMTGAWVEALLKDSMGNEITQYYVQEYGIETMFSSDIHNWMPTGKRWNGYVTFTAADGNATYRGQVTAVNVTNSITYPSSVLSTDISVTDNPLLMSNVGQAANDTGGFALKLIIGVIIVLGLMAIPFLITREFNTYIEVFMIVLGLGLNYYLGLIDLWIIAGLGILAAVIVFFMSTGGRGGGDSTEGGGGDVG